MGDTIKKAIRMLFTREMLSYIFFGVCTTVVNIAVFQACTALLHWNWAVSNVLAWVLSVLSLLLPINFSYFKAKNPVLSASYGRLLLFLRLVSSPWALTWPVCGCFWIVWV